MFRNYSDAQVCDWLKDSLKAKGVSAVEISTRLTDSAATLVQGAYGVSPTMQRYMKAQVSNKSIDRSID
jgi:HSP90 family molecular chaperone|tara:strand:+ start:91 stop:297 length:207 start_codon:yes stop_codon:yes gene_type:complete